MTGVLPSTRRLASQSHNREVEAICPEAFTVPLAGSHRFPCAPRYRKCERVARRGKASDREVGRAPLPSLTRIIRCLTRLFLVNTFVFLPAVLHRRTQETRFSCQGTSGSIAYTRTNVNKTRRAARRQHTIHPLDESQGLSGAISVTPTLSP